MVEEYILLLYKVQLHVSVLDNGHLQVVHEIISKQVIRDYIGCIQWVGGEVGTRSRMYHRGCWCGYMGIPLSYITSS